MRGRGNVSGFTGLRLFKKEIFNDTVRSRSVEELLDWLSGFDTDYIIVGGDFNTFPLSKPIRKMTEIFNDAMWPTKCYFTGTYTDLTRKEKDALVRFSFDRTTTLRFDFHLHRSIRVVNMIAPGSCPVWLPNIVAPLSFKATLPALASKLKAPGPMLPELSTRIEVGLRPLGCVQVDAAQAVAGLQPA